MTPLSAGIGGLVLGALGAAAVMLLLGSCGSKVTGRAFDPALPTFPSTSGENLNKRKFEVPGGLDAPYNVLMVAFYQKQQEDVNTWLPLAKEIADDHANVEYYELPTISSGWTLVKGWIDGGMRSGIPAYGARERTITLYTDTAKFRELAGIDNPQRIWVGVVDREGRVYWSARGPATGAAKEELRRVVREVAG